MSSTETKSEFKWGDKVLHRDFGEGIVIKMQVGLVSVYFKKDGHIICRLDDKKLSYLEADF